MSRIREAKVDAIFLNNENEPLGDYDVTSDFCQAMIDFFGNGDTIELASKDGKNKYQIILKRY